MAAPQYTSYPSRIRLGTTSLITPAVQQTRETRVGTGGTTSRSGRTLTTVNYAERDDDYETSDNNSNNANNAQAQRGQAAAAYADNVDYRGFVAGPPSDTLVQKKQNLRTRHPQRTDEQVRGAADEGGDEVLIPIRLDLNLGEFKFKDTFMWNMNEELISPDAFAMILCADLSIPPAIFASQISTQIRTQIEEYAPLASINLPPEADLRAIVDISLHLSRHLFTDKFEWDLTGDGDVYGWTKRICEDLGVTGEWVGAICHAVHEQLLQLKKTACEGGLPAEVDNDAPYGAEAGVRVDQDGLGALWAPKVEVLSREEVEKRDGDRDRVVRRNRREAARFGSGAPPPVQSERRRGARERTQRSPSPTGRTPGPGANGAVILTDMERLRWRCEHCGIGGTGTWAARKGPSGAKSLCNSCGLFWAKEHKLPMWRQGMFSGEYR
ncbi:SNF5-domain-containing protein [Saitoella complicata NRRL Y-17804]|nr:SNF5-domain-containing protein [Saitoella complicata NRRL Y-17804]ODQ49737.1 SNF5-domain-containing protein [Saitoella complicata NRRL Y-17804]